jgi:hypothetical protein
VVLAAWVGVLALAGCDDSTEAPSTPPSPSESRAEIVEVIGGLQDALADGDGATACAYMTSRGQRLYPKAISNAGTSTSGTCEGAVEAASARLTREDRKLAEENVVKPYEVSLSNSGKAAEAASDYRGAMRLTLVGDEWLVDVPFFAD